MSELPPCPKCASQYTYQDGLLLVCPECAHEWSGEAAVVPESQPGLVRDANGNELRDGDTVLLIKDLKVRGYPLPLKIGTKVKGIRLVEGDHDIDCRIEGIGAMQLKSKFVRKVF